MTAKFALGLLAFLMGCNEKDTPVTDDTGDVLPTGTTDLDGDGYFSDEDCDDLSAATHPGAAELCDGTDNDCDEEVDENVTLTWYEDADADGYGGALSTTEACSRPEGYVPTATDCDDSRDDIWPGAPELCDGADNDCDTQIDEGSTTPWYADADGDGYGDVSEQTSACEAPDGYVANDDDCDDGSADTYPDAPELCDEQDNNCDGDIDEGDDLGATWYSDRDEDGYGDPTRSTFACAAPAGYVADGTDCDDLEPSTYPGADETCDKEDDDCDGTVDEADATDAADWYADSDKDGYGDAGSLDHACTAPTGYISDATDCDDGDSGIHPGATETCDGADEDCDGTVDEDDAVDAGDWYADTDSDGYGDADIHSVSCAAPSGYVSNAQDCDDADAAISPVATEICDGLDNDCDVSIDEDSASDAVVWYSDRDSDGFGDPTRSDIACEAPTGYVEDDTDCDDLDVANHPGADEVCDKEDNDCDGSTDEADAIDAGTWYSDVDGDSYGAPATGVVACTAPSETVADNTDCDDTAAAAHPGGTEVCDALDNDCDGSVDEAGAYGETDWYPDDDSDGYGDATATAVTSCDSPTGSVATRTDCDDADSGVNPGQTEYCDGEDENCDGTEDGAVSFVNSSGTWSDLSTSFGAGKSTSPASITLSTSGTLWVCDGTYYVNIASAAADMTIYGYNGLGGAVLDGAGKGRTIYATGDLEMEGITLSGGYTSTNGGNLYVYLSDAMLTDVAISGGEAKNGGNVGCYSCNLTMTDVDIENGDASSQGGGLYNYKGTVDGVGVLIDSNDATYGAGIYAQTTTGSLTGSLVSNNRAGTSGGAMYLSGGTWTLSSTDLEDNDGGDYGGGAYLSVATMSLTSGNVSGNAASLLGAGLYLGGASTMTCTGTSSTTAGIWGNTALAAGGAYIASTSAKLVSKTCDWTATQDNTLYDIVTSSFYLYTVGDNASFTCSGGSC